MLTRLRVPRSWVVLGVLVAVQPPLTAADPDQPVDFARQILPILSNKCFVCHGPAGEAKDVLRLDSFAASTEQHEGRRAIDDVLRPAGGSWKSRDSGETSQARQAR